MKNLRNRKNKFRNNGRNYRSNGSLNFKQSYDKSINSSFQRRSPGRNNHNASKLIEKYTNLAREALSSGDKILSENYHQHADHFLRIMAGQKILKAESTKESNKLVGAEINENGSSDTNNKTIEPEAK